MYGTAVQRTVRVSVSDECAELRQNGTCWGFHSAHLITLERQVSLLKGTIYGNELISLF